MKAKGGFLTMILSVLGIVIFTTMFQTIHTALGTLRSASGVSDFIAFTTVVGIAPVVLFLAGIFGGSYAYFKGFQSVSASGTDTRGFMRMVTGVLMIILFVTIFSTITDAIHAVWNNSGGANLTVWIALRTVTSIAPTILFLGGIFAGGSTAYSGIKSYRRGRRRMA